MARNKTRKKDEAGELGDDCLLIENGGPIERLVLRIPKDGGVVLLRGENGAGKSRALEAVETLLTGRGRVDVRDGAPLAKVEGFGAKLTIGRSQRRSGELIVGTLEGRLDLSTLVDPGIKDELAADAKRIKSLLTVAGATINRSAFRELFDDEAEFARFVTATGPSDAGDLVEFSDDLRRSLQAAARANEIEADSKESAARGMLATIGDVDLTVADASIDELALRSALVDSVSRQSRIEAEIVAHAKATQARAKAKAELDATLADLDKRRPSKDIAAARIEFEGFESALVRELDEIDRQRAAISDRLSEVRRSLAKAVDDEAEAKKIETAVARLRESADAEIASPPTAEEIADAELAVAVATKAAADGSRTREAKRIAAAAEKTIDEANVARARATAHRAQADRVDNVLSKLVATVCPEFAVAAGRLLVCRSTDDRELYDRLSEGERWVLGIDVAVEALKAADATAVGVVVIPQVAWDGLTTRNRDRIHAHAKRRRVVIVTAERADDVEEVVAVEYRGGESAA